MPIQRQSEQFSVFDTGTRWERDRPQHELPRGLAGLVNSMGPRITGGMLNTRTAGVEEFLADDDDQEDEDEDYSDLPAGLRELIGPPYEEDRRHHAGWFEEDPDLPPRLREVGLVPGGGVPHHEELAELDREHHEREFPHGDYTGDIYPSDDDHDGSYWPGSRTSGWHHPDRRDWTDYDPADDFYDDRPSRADFAEEEAELARKRNYPRGQGPAWNYSEDGDPDPDLESLENTADPERFISGSRRRLAVEEDYSGGDEDDPDWIRENSPRQQEHNRKRGEEIRHSKEMFGSRLPFDRAAGRRQAAQEPVEPWMDPEEFIKYLTDRNGKAPDSISQGHIRDSDDTFLHNWWQELEKNRGKTPEQLQQEREQGRARAKELADGLWNAFYPPEEEEGRKAVQNIDTVNNLIASGWQPEHIKYDEEDEPYALYQHPSGWTVKDSGSNYKEVGHAATPDEYHDVINVSRYDRDGGESYNNVFGPADAHAYIEDQLGDDPSNNNPIHYHTKNHPAIRRYRPRQAHRLAKDKDGKCTCWEGYERVPGTEPCADGSCRKKTKKKESHRGAGKGIDWSHARPGPWFDAPLYKQDPHDPLNWLPYDGPVCPVCNRFTKLLPKPGCREHHASHTAGFINGLPDGADSASWEQGEQGWTHSSTGCRVQPSTKFSDEWEMVAPTSSKRRPYSIIGHHPDPQVLMDEHDWQTGYGPAPSWHGEPKWWHRVISPPLPPHTAGWADDNPEYDELMKHIDEQLAQGERDNNREVFRDPRFDGDNGHRPDRNQELAEHGFSTGPGDVMRVAWEGKACPDCAMAIANSDDSGASPGWSWDAMQSGINSLPGDGDVHLNCDEDDDCDSHFQRGPCDLCGNPDSGTFHPVVTLERNRRYAAAPMDLQIPQGGGYQIAHRVGLPWRDQIIPGTVIGLDGPNVAVRWDDGQYSTEEPHNIQLL